MDDFSVPSFSLGFDLDIEDLPTEGKDEEEEAEHPRIQPDVGQRNIEETSFLEPSVQDSEDGGGELTLGVVHEEEHPSSRILKRLRRGPPPPTSPKAVIFRSSVDGADSTHESPQLMSLCDEIEEFSSPEKEPQLHTVKMDVKRLKRLGRPQIREFFTTSNTRPVMGKRSLFLENVTESFWKDFSPKKNSRIATPALDEFCKGYFCLVKAQNVNQERRETSTSGFSSSRVFNTDYLTYKFEDSYHRRNWNINSNWDLSSPRPPAFHYINHIDPRVRKLIRQRLQHFIPLEVKNNNQTQQFGAAALDYMSQFSSGNARGKAQDVLEKVSRTSSRKKQNNRSCSNVIKASAGAGSWMNPKSKSYIPKDAGKRRVSAVAHGSGHRFTGQDGRKMYVSKNGQELSCRMAYSEYKKKSVQLWKCKGESSGCA